MSPLTDSPSICASAAAASVAENSPDTVFNRARDTVPSFRRTLPLTVVASISALPAVNSMSPLTDLTSIIFADIAAHRVGVQVPASLSADAAAHASQLQGAANGGDLEVRPHQRGGDRAVG